MKLEKLQIAQHHCEQALSLLEQNMDPKSVKDNKYWFEVQKGNITSLIEVQRKRDMEREKKRLEKRAIESSLASKLEIRGVKFGAPLFGQQRRYKITQPVEKEGTLHWPLLLVYSSGNSKSSVGTVQGDQSDYLEDVPENASMDDILTSVFSENMPPPAWDVNRQYYSADNLEMRFRKNWTIKKSEEDCEEDEDGSMLSPDELGTWVKLKGDRTLADVVAMRDYVTPLFPVLYVVPKRMRLS